MPATTKLVERTKVDLTLRTYLPGIWVGLEVTTRHFARNLSFLVTGRKHGKNPARDQLATIRYPEETRPYPSRYRGHHRLMRREDGQVRCVACFMCSTACPADCIYIEAAEHDDPGIEKAPVRFDIDHLVCVYCGMCEEACPCDAIRLDSGVHPAPRSERQNQRRGLIDLLELGGPSVARQGGKYA
jgi:NADH-quinone oxidoreductase subunit I